MNYIESTTTDQILNVMGQSDKLVSLINMVSAAKRSKQYKKYEQELSRLSNECLRHQRNVRSIRMDTKRAKLEELLKGFRSERVRLEQEVRFIGKELWVFK